MADIDHLTDLFSPLGGVSFKRMFSGYGIMKNGVMFALISRDILYFRTDDAVAERHKAEGAPQWQPHMRGKTMTTMPYWQVPERLFDEAEEFADWARRAFVIAERHKKENPAKKKPVAAKKRAAAKKPPSAKSAKPKTRAAPKRR